MKNENDNFDDDLIDTELAAEKLKHSPGTVANWRTLRVGPPYIKLGHRVLYSKRDLREWLESKKIRH